ncbi:PPE domain-containing protein, partial [Prauserella alba]
MANCLPLPWPPREPEGPPPGKDALESEFDWQALPHRELHRMATMGVDAETADQVAGKWANLGAELQNIGDSLRTALRDAAEGWQGGGVEQARRRVDQLSTWTDQTARDSHGVGTAIQAQAHLAQWAKNNMPEPPLSLHPWPWLPLPTLPVEPIAPIGGLEPHERDDVVALGGRDPEPGTRSGLSGEIDVLGDGASGETGGATGRRPGDGGWALGGGAAGSGGAGSGGSVGSSADGSSAAGSGGAGSAGAGSGGGGGGFADAAGLPLDPITGVEQREELHRQAAQVMRTYQLESGNVFRGVPQFVMPGEDIIKDDPREPGKPAPSPENPGTDPSRRVGPQSPGGGGLPPGVVAAPLAAGAASGMAAGAVGGAPGSGMQTGAGAAGASPGAAGGQAP